MVNDVKAKKAAVSDKEKHPWGTDAFPLKNYDL